MATYTENLNLKKPDFTDIANINDINNNMDILDEEVVTLRTEFDDVGDYVVEQGTSGEWEYIKYNSGICIAWCEHTFNNVTFSAAGNVYRSPDLSFDTPSGLFTSITTVNANSSASSVIIGASMSEGDNFSSIHGYLYKLNSNSASHSVQVSVFGKWK